MAKLLLGESATSEKSDLFVVQVEKVVTLFEQTLSSQDWISRRDPKRMRDESGNVFSVPALMLFKGSVRLLLDPNGYDIPGAEGVIDLYLLPSYDLVATLSLEDGDWFLRSPDLNDLDQAANPNQWTRSDLNGEVIQTVLEEIAKLAVPSV